MSSLATLLVLFLAALAGGAAWGPGTHIQLAGRLLRRMDRRLAKSQRELLTAHTEAFLYGNIAADIISFKKFGGLRNHCHNWNMKERFEALIQTEHEQAFLYGYLCHLAADVVAHNHFVPFHMLHGLPPMVLGHTYWEARADDVVHEEHWQTIDGLRNRRELHQNDQMINQAVRKKALSLASNKWIFNNVLLARSKRGWRDIMDQMRSRRPVGTLQHRFLDECHERCLENMWLVFDALDLEHLKQWDPSGLGALREARLERRRLIAHHGSREAGARAAQDLAVKMYGLEAAPRLVRPGPRTR